MKKTYFKFLNALVILCVSLSFMACSGDDDDKSKDDESSPEKVIIGKWQPTKIDGENVINNYLFSMMQDDVMEIKADKTVTYNENGTYYGINQTTSLYPSKSTWSVSYESNLWKAWILNFKGNGVFFFAEDFKIVKVDENTLVLDNGFEYEFKRIK